MNNVIIVSICAWAISQLIKVITGLVQKKHIDFRSLTASGGMPSSHSAIVSSLATSVAITEGFESIAFGISVILALVVMYDAAGLRRSVGKQAVVLNRILSELRERRPVTDLEQDIRELVGHTPFQVIVGALLGTVIACLWFTFIA